ncbi:DUF427 domain-containing protein [soil metagenome]
MGMKAIWNDTVIAESDDTIYLEGNHYFPPESLDRDHLASSRLRTLCPWKGIASYHTIEAGDSSLRDGAWTYRRPFPWIRKIRHHVAFSDDVEIQH